MWPPRRSPRRFIVALALSLLVAPFVAEAQRPTDVSRIGYLDGNAPSASAHLFEAFRQGLRALGYVEGQNLTIEERWASGQRERLPALAAELVQRRVALIVAPGSAARVAQHTTTTIPIVFHSVSDPIGMGLIASLARPGGNATGLTHLGLQLGGKRLELLKEALPELRRVAVLIDPGVPGPTGWEEAEAAARALGMTPHRVEVRSVHEWDRAFAAMTQEGVGALLVQPLDYSFFNDRRRLMELALKSRLPTISWRQELAEAGGLMAYGSNNADEMRRAATFVDKILKGAKPADLPVEQPMKFELVINLKTAKALGLTIPPTLLFQADEVIQ
jgi:putative tryptophan/tyrosine transport system substrate-binding protein